MSVSTHAPLAGSDDTLSFGLQVMDEVSTHAPLAGSDVIASTFGMPHAGFQPTLPLRGATLLPPGQHPSVGIVSTHAPLAGSDFLQAGLDDFAAVVSTHAPLAGSDSFAQLSGCTYLVSTHAPLAGSDSPGARSRCGTPVSTHAPLAGSDSCRRSGSQAASGFNPRSPCGERPASPGHARRPWSRFNPRSPCGERRPRQEAFDRSFGFNPRDRVPNVGVSVVSPNARRTAIA